MNLLKVRGEEKTCMYMYMYQRKMEREGERRILVYEESACFMELLYLSKSP